METKICRKCNEEKELCFFSKNRAECKSCKKIYNSQYYEKNKKEIISKIIEKNINNYDEYLLKKKLSYEKNRENNLNKKKLKYNQDKQKYIEKVKIYSEKNKEKIKETKSIYYQINKKKFNTYYKQKYKKDIKYRLCKIIRKRIYDYLKNNRENIKYFEIVGCTPSELKVYIENLFTNGMSWELMGSKIHIDHIIPLSSAKNEEEIYKLCHYTNLQPLWAKENLSKGSKII